MIVVESFIEQEVVHFADEQLQIYSKFNKVFLYSKGFCLQKISLPLNALLIFIGQFRIVRRFLRLDKSCVLKTSSGLIIFWQRCVYFLSDGNKSGLIRTLTLTGCRNPLHNSIANVDGNIIFFGEYGKPHKLGKSIYKSCDGGMTWNKVFHFSCDKIRHIHSCKWDPFEKKIWVFTGDFDGQCRILCADLNFCEVEEIGDGSQYFRAVDAVFEKDSVHWIMDSPLKSVHHIRLDRSSRRISIGQEFDGPGWYMKKLTDGITLSCTTQEIGPSHKDKKVHLMATRDYETWVDIAQFEHDGLKKGLFKFGVGAFSAGNQTSSSFYMHFEAIKGLDGRSARIKIMQTGSIGGGP